MQRLIPGRFTAGALLRQGPLAGAAQAREAQSMKVVQARMKSVKNMQKITKAMKMVAAAKLRTDQRNCDIGLPWAAPVQRLFQRLPAEPMSGTITYLPLTSDKGLCGGVNTQVVKSARLGIMEDEAKGNICKVMMLGGKGVGALKRLYGDRFTHSFEEVVKHTWNFTTASLVAERVVHANPQRLKLISNQFKSMAVYNTLTKHFFTKEECKTMDKQEWSKAVDVYSFEPSVFEVWDDLHEFYYGCTIYGAYLDSATCEQSQRMSAMENATKNAGEMFEKLQLIYNRGRQAKITNELCEIISGASAV